jgi:hypothetical protein
MTNYPDRLDAVTRSLYLKYQAIVEEYAKKIDGRPDGPDTEVLNAELAAKLDALIAEFVDGHL